MHGIDPGPRHEMDSGPIHAMDPRSIHGMDPGSTHWMDPESIHGMDPGPIHGIKSFTIFYLLCYSAIHCSVSKTYHRPFWTDIKMSSFGSQTSGCIKWDLGSRKFLTHFEVFWYVVELLSLFHTHPLFCSIKLKGAFFSCVTGFYRISISLTGNNWQIFISDNHMHHMRSIYCALSMHHIPFLYLPCYFSTAR